MLERYSRMLVRVPLGQLDQTRSTSNQRLLVAQPTYQYIADFHPLGFPRLLGSSLLGMAGFGSMEIGKIYPLISRDMVRSFIRLARSVAFIEDDAPYTRFFLSPS